MTVRFFLLKMLWLINTGGLFTLLHSIHKLSGGPLRNFLLDIFLGDRVYIQIDQHLLQQALVIPRAQCPASEVNHFFNSCQIICCDAF